MEPGLKDTFESVLTSDLFHCCSDQRHVFSNTFYHPAFYRFPFQTAILVSVTYACVTSLNYGSFETFFSTFQELNINVVMQRVNGYGSKQMTRSEKINAEVTRKE